MTDPITVPVSPTSLSPAECVICEIALSEFVSNLDLSMYSGQMVAQIINKLENMVSQSMAFNAAPPLT